MKISIVNRSEHLVPCYSTEFSAGMDIRADIDEDIVLEPPRRALIKADLFVEINVGYEAQIRPRGGLALNKGIKVLNSPGTIDADYRGKVCIILINLSDEIFVVKDGERIGQMIISRHERAEWEVGNELANSGRGTGGFGHTGKD